VQIGGIAAREGNFPLRIGKPGWFTGDSVVLPGLTPGSWISNLRCRRGHQASGQRIRPTQSGFARWRRSKFLGNKVNIEDMRTADPRRFAMANALRVLAMDAVEAAQSGHPGMPMGMADVVAVLFDGHLKFDPAAPEWPDRDRFVLSAGHGSMLLYGLLHLTVLMP
jgi:hypothetical protein